MLAVAAVALGAACLAYGATGLPLRGPIRGHVGDVAAAALVYALLGVAAPGRRWLRGAIAAAICVAVELGQRRAAPSSGAVDTLVLGTRFDPWDLVAYAVGLALACAWDVRASARALGRGRPLVERSVRPGAARPTAAARAGERTRERL
ncbi:MAG TPA: DUF2809 domain-containing protein [Kofleriaceae bacterium]|nr:DUF2809 domain-containing protein [Kofleriaceae bacterium]